MDDLDAELARFEAEISSLEQASAADATLEQAATPGGNEVPMQTPSATTAAHIQSQPQKQPPVIQRQPQVISSQPMPSSSSTLSQPPSIAAASPPSGAPPMRAPPPSGPPPPMAPPTRIPPPRPLAPPTAPPPMSAAAMQQQHAAMMASMPPPPPMGSYPPHYGMQGMQPGPGMQGMQQGGMYQQPPQQHGMSGGPSGGIGIAQLKAMEAEKKAKEAERKGLVMQAAGKRWRDPTLDDWPENDHRIFVGDLGNEVTDDSLKQAFCKYTSFAKAKVVRDPRTKKSKGFGFVSFLDSADFAKALREMQGKYIGNRPCKLSKSSWDERLAPIKRQKR